MSVVYFIRPIGMAGPVKIGCSRFPKGRRDALRTWSPFPLEVHAEIAGDFDLERRFHALFHEDHEGCEWFKWTERLELVMQQVRDGSFDIATLPQPCRGNSIKKGAAWDDEMKRRMRLTILCSRKGSSTGFLPPANYEALIRSDDPADWSLIEAYLADPATHGRAVPYTWAVEKQRRFLAKRPVAA